MHIDSFKDRTSFNVPILFINLIIHLLITKKKLEKGEKNI